MEYIDIANEDGVTRFVFNEDGEFSGYEAKFSEDGNSLTVVPYFDDGTVVGEGILLEWKDGQFFSPQR